MKLAILTGGGDCPGMNAYIRGVTRIARHYDPEGEVWEWHEPETHLVPLVLDAAAGRRPSITVFGQDMATPDGTAVRDYVHVLDLADAHLRALDAAPKLSGGYNLGSGRGYSVREVVQTVESVTERDIPVIEEPRRPGDPAALTADPGKIERELGWWASRSLDDAVRDAWSFRLAHHARQGEPSRRRELSPLLL